MDVDVDVDVRPGTPHAWKDRVTSGEIHTFDAPFLLGFCSKCYMDMDMDVDVDVDVDVFAYGCGSGTHGPHAILLGIP